MQQNLSAPLTDDELDKLESMLASFPDSMNLEMLDGFFAALVCSPELVMPSTYIPHILGTDESQFADLEEVKEFYGLIVRHWNAVARSLHDDELYDLVVIDYEDDESYGNAWALGFMLGFKIGGEAWEDLLEDEQHGRLLIPILALAHEHDPDPEMRPEPITKKQRDMMLVTISTSLKHIFKYFEPHRLLSSVPPKLGSQTIKHPSRKMGRNERCPCGSNRKYKQCCGRN